MVARVFGSPSTNGWCELIINRRERDNEDLILEVDSQKFAYRELSVRLEYQQPIPLRQADKVYMLVSEPTLCLDGQLA